MDMVEKVARIIEAALERHGVTEFEGTIDDARAAIEAMRTPTEEMLKAGGAVEVPRGYGDEDWNEEIGEYEAESAYNAMISAALSPSGEKQ